MTTGPDPTPRAAPDRSAVSDGIDALGLAQRLADLADRLALEGHASPLDITLKPDGSIVTAVDAEIEDRLVACLLSERPGVGVLAEESGVRSSQRPERWIIDPIDGTSHFAAGAPHHATLIACERHGHLVAGLVSAPRLRRRWWASIGAGATCSVDGVPSPAGVSPTASLRRARGFLRAEWRFAEWGLPGLGQPWALRARLTDRGADVQRPRATWECVRVADGSFDFAVVGGNRWDVAAPAAIVAEAGGVTVEIQAVGAPDRLTVVMTNGRLGDEIAVALGIDARGHEPADRRRPFVP